eukprot:TRINITY_DN6968_c1_g1_i1.p1 TRINITY_DN6968_c1_g1~~TRINITY_DN6968_c1_g1_i1.p1  ORF type:complete len:489 (+),score=102.34 TRINITY_DN6968_c1_g1_i1:114-1580(+)
MSFLTTTQTRRSEQGSNWGIGNPSDDAFAGQSATQAAYGDPGRVALSPAAPRGTKTQSNFSLTWQGNRDFQGVSSSASSYGDPGALSSSAKSAPAMDKLYQQRTSLLIGNPTQGGGYVTTAKESYFPQPVEMPELRQGPRGDGVELTDRLDRPCFETTSGQHFKQYDKLPDYTRTTVDKTASTVFQGSKERYFEATSAQQFKAPPPGSLATSVESQDRGYNMRRAHFSHTAGGELEFNSTSKSAFPAPPPGSGPPTDFVTTARKSKIELGDGTKTGRYESTSRASFVDAGPASPRSVDRQKLVGTHFRIGENSEGRYDSTSKHSFPDYGRVTPPQRIAPSYGSNVVTGDQRTHELCSTSKESYAASGPSEPVFAQGAALFRNNQRTHFELGQPKIFSPDSTFRSVASTNYPDHGVQPLPTQKSQLSSASPFATDPTSRDYATQSGLAFVRPPADARPSSAQRITNQSHIRLGTKEHDLTTSYMANYSK